MIDYSIIGKRFGNLTVISLDHITTNHNNFDDIDEYLNKED